MNRSIITLTLLLLGITASAYPQTIAEKKAGLCYGTMDLSKEMQESLEQVNQEIEAQQNELRFLYAQVWNLYRQGAGECAYKELLEKINGVKQRRIAIENRWREMATHNQDEGYALWHQPNTTIEQLLIDYGSQDYVYLIPPEIADMVVSINSNIPIPRASWNEMLETILNQSGVGIKQLNPFLRQLYLIKEDHSAVRLVTNKRQELSLLPGTGRIAFVLTPEPSDVRRVWMFLEKFANPHSVFLQLLGRDILIIAQVAEIQELLKLYDFVTANRGNRDYKLVTVSRVDAEEISKILGAVFGVLSESAPEGPAATTPLPTRAGPAGRQGPPAPPAQLLMRPSNAEDNGLRIIPLAKIAQAIFLIGTREEIRKAESLIREIEDQVGESRGKTIFRYAAKHSDPEELAQVLTKIYALMVTSGATDEDEQYPPLPPPPGINLDKPFLRRPYDEGFFLDDRFVINKRPPLSMENFNQNRDNFIVDPKTGSIVMVVETDILPKLKDLLRKLDVPKKMVQVDVLLFEKRLAIENNFGLNLLKIGSCASHTNSTCATFNARPAIDSPLGIFEFLVSRTPCHGVPAYDLSYRFLLSQDDVQINANPSIVAINQTPARIEIAEEISVSTGIFEVETISGVTLKDAFARAQYGIKIDILPTIHIGEDEYSDEDDYVTLATDITFQSFRPTLNDRPDVTTRHIVNEVSIPNGQTVILGGLRQRNTHENVEKIPFLGDIPGVGKLFSLNDLRDETTEMFIFLTPRIIYDPAEDLECVKLMELSYRPGDIPAFLCAVSRAHDWERDRLFHSSMMLLFGRCPDRCVIPGEYDGR